MDSKINYFITKNWKLLKMEIETCHCTIHRAMIVI